MEKKETKKTTKLDRYQALQIKCPECGKTVSPVMEWDADSCGGIRASIPMAASGDSVEICWSTADLEMDLMAHCPECGCVIGDSYAVEKLWEKSKAERTSEWRSYILPGAMREELIKSGVANDTIQFIMMQLYGQLVTNADIDGGKGAAE